MTFNIFKKQARCVIVFKLIALSFFLMAQSTYAVTSFSNNADGTVTERLSKLMWQRCSAPAEEVNCVTTPLLYNWDNALAYCNSLTLAGHTDWRLPNVKELQSIIDVDKTVAPSINTFYFTDTQSSDYWSSTTFTGTNVHAWYVNFDIGGSFVMTSGVDKMTPNNIRCVRGA